MNRKFRLGDCDRCGGRGCQFCDRCDCERCRADELERERVREAARLRRPCSCGQMPEHRQPVRYQDHHHSPYPCTHHDRHHRLHQGPYHDCQHMPPHLSLASHSACLPHSHQYLSACGCQIPLHFPRQIHNIPEIRLRLGGLVDNMRFHLIRGIGCPVVAEVEGAEGKPRKVRGKICNVGTDSLDLKMKNGTITTLMLSRLHSLHWPNSACSPCDRCGHHGHSCTCI